jgi:hypothetical protein
VKIRHLAGIGPGRCSSRIANQLCNLLPGDADDLITCGPAPTAGRNARGLEPDGIRVCEEVIAGLGRCDQTGSDRAYQHHRQACWQRGSCPCHAPCYGSFRVGCGVTGRRTGITFGLFGPCHDPWQTGPDLIPSGLPRTSTPAAALRSMEGVKFGAGGRRWRWRRPSSSLAPAGPV